MTPRERRLAAVLGAAVVLSGLVALRGAEQNPAALPSPEQFFGFQMGADRKLANWDRLLDYYRRLDASDRMTLVELGRSSEDRPFVALFISSPSNLASLEQFRQINLRLADPRGLAEAEARALAATGRSVVVQSFALHSSEVAASQTAAEYVYDSLTREDPDARRIRDEVISIVLPSINPDGTQMIADWYNTYVGTEYEAAGLPWAHVFGVQATLLGVRGALPLELHVVEPTDAATPTTLRPVAGYRSLVRRRGGDALYDLLRHAVVQHPHRRGHLRDLVVLADAVRLCEQGELDAVRERCRGQAHSVELLAMLDQSSALAARSPVADPDATRRIVAQKYLLSSGREAWIARVVPRWHGRLAYVPLERRALRRSELGALARDTMRAHPAYDLPMLAARAPRTARLAAAMVAAGYRLMLATLVLGYGPAVRARVERLLRGGVASRRTPPVHAPPAGELERAAR